MKEYKFDLTETPLRLHRLYAYASSDEELRVASAKKLVPRFEERFLGLSHFEAIGRTFMSIRHQRTLTLKIGLKTHIPATAI